MKRYIKILLLAVFLSVFAGTVLAARQFYQKLLKAQEERQCRTYVLDSMAGVIQVFNHVKKRHPESIEEAQEWGRGTFDYTKEPDYCKIHSKALITVAEGFTIAYKTNLEFVPSGEGTYSWEIGENSRTYLWMYEESDKK